MSLKGREGDRLCSPPFYRSRGIFTKLCVLCLETTEGLEQKLVKNYYGSIRFTHQLLPLLQSASPELSRVVSVLGAGNESNSFKLSDLDLKQNLGLMQAAVHATVMTDFAFE